MPTKENIKHYSLLQTLSVLLACFMKKFFHFSVAGNRFTKGSKLFENLFTGFGKFMNRGSGSIVQFEKIHPAIHYIEIPANKSVTEIFCSIYLMFLTFRFTLIIFS